MSDFVPHKRSLERRAPLRKLRTKPRAIEFTPNNATKVQFPDGTMASGTCLGCHDAPCMEFDALRMDLGGELSAFPGDPIRDVCPTNAIDWDDAGETVQINEDQCIGCGLCALNCPYGAISLTLTGQAFVETGDPDEITEQEAAKEAKHVAVPKTGSLGDNTSDFLKALPEVLSALNDAQTTRLVRNLLLSCGISAQMRRKGDTNVRMDGLLRFSTGKIGVVELETSQAVLESPRALLEDIAVLNNRFKVPVENIIPLSLIGAFPNVRVEYYQVIDDIEKVLGIQCHTLTVGALCVLAWHFKAVNKLGKAQFVTTSGATDLYPSLRAFIDDLSSHEPYSGAYRPTK
jgi:ferredoxin